MTTVQEFNRSISGGIQERVCRLLQKHWVCSKFSCDGVYRNLVTFLLPASSSSECVEVRSAVPCPSQTCRLHYIVVFTWKGFCLRRHQTAETCHFCWVMKSWPKNLILLSDLNPSLASSPCIWFCHLQWIKGLFKRFVPS